MMFQDYIFILQKRVYTTSFAADGFAACYFWREAKVC